MMTDKLLRFCEKKALAADMTTDIVDIGPADAGIGRNMDIYIIVADADATDMAVEFLTSDDAAMASPVKPVTFHIAAAEVAAGGKVVRDRIPAGCLRYVQLKFTGPTSGTASAGLVKDS